MNSVRALQERLSSYSSDMKLIDIKRLGRPTPDLMLRQKVTSGSRTFFRYFKRRLYDDADWLCGCDITQSLFCFPCLLFGGERTWTETGNTDLNHIASNLKKHELSQCHMKNVINLALVGAGEFDFDPKYRKSKALHNENIRKNRFVLSNIISSIIFCGSFELASQVYDESNAFSNKGHLQRLINLSTELNTAVESHLLSVPFFKHNPKTIQNELLNIMLDVTQEKIAEEVRETQFLSIIVEETSDVSDVLQMSLVFRYIVQGIPVERFWGFFTPENHDPQTLASCILSELERLKLNENPNKVIAQTFNGPSVVTGVHGVQAIIKKEYPCAEYVHYHSHQLSLIIMNAASVKKNARIFFCTWQSVGVFFRTNAPKNEVFDDIVKEILPESLCTDSWSINMVFIFRKQIIECLRVICDKDEIKNMNVICQANSFAKILSSTSFIFWISLFHSIMKHLEVLLSELQRRDIKSSVVKCSIEKFEKDVNNIKNKFNTCKNNIDEMSPAAPKKYRAENSEMKKEAMEVCDVIICHVKERFSYCGHLIASNLVSTQSSTFVDKVHEVCEAYPILETKKLQSELTSIHSVNELSSLCSVFNLYNFIRTNRLESAFSETAKLLKIILTTPTARTEAETCLPTLEQVRAFLRNTMSDERLSALAMLSIERDLIMSIPDFNQRVTGKFAAREKWCTDFCFK